jgi:hypothetical protein
MDGMSFMITYREADDPARRANLDRVLAWLAGAGLHEAILVEQDSAPH